MAYTVEVRLKEDGDWIPIIDMRLSKTKKVKRIFFTEESAQFYIDNTLKGTDPGNVRMLEVDDEVQPSTT